MHHILFKFVIDLVFCTGCIHLTLLCLISAPLAGCEWQNRTFAWSLDACQRCRCRSKFIAIISISLFTGLLNIKPFTTCESWQIDKHRLLSTNHYDAKSVKVTKSIIFWSITSPVRKGTKQSSNIFLHKMRIYMASSS